jgi:hypothetical protein
VNVERVKELRDSGMGASAIAKGMGIGSHPYTLIERLILSVCQNGFIIYLNLLTQTNIFDKNIEEIIILHNEINNNFRVLYENVGYAKISKPKKERMGLCQKWH